MDESEIYERAIDRCGIKAQIMMVFEETAELQKEICKNWRGANNADQIAEEIADVEIMLAQLKMIYGIADDVRRYKDSKLKRLIKRLQEV